MKKIALGLVAVITLGAVGCGFINMSSSYPQNVNEWTQEMRQAAPDKFAELAEQTVNANLQTIDERLSSIRLAAGQLAKRHKDSSEKFNFGRQFGKELVAAEKKGEFPVTILGVEYEEFQLASQKQLVASELIVHESIMKAVKKTSDLLEKEKRDLMLYRGKCKGQLDMLQAQVEIFKARQISLEGLTLLDECADVLLDAGTYLAKLDPVADIETLMKRAEAEAESNENKLDLETVLASFNEEDAAEVEEAVKKAEDFGNLEAILDIETEEASLDIETEVDVKFEGKEKGAKDLPTTLEENEIPEEPAL